MIGVAVILVGWVALVVGCLLAFGVFVLIPAGAVMCAAGFLLDWEVMARGKRP